MIKIFACPNCGIEDNESTYCPKCTNPRHYLKERLRLKKIVEGDYIIIGYVGTATNAEIILQDIETQEEFNISLNQFFPMIKGLKFEDLKLRERKQGQKYSWEIVNDKK